MTELPHPVTGGLFVSPVPPGAGWPGERAAPDTSVADGPADVVRLARSAAALDVLEARSSVCRACPRLVRWREQVAVEKRRSLAAEPYWGRPVAGWGSAEPKVLVVGLAPAAHGGNRTGRIFTGDRSGDWLFASLHRVGLAGQATSVHSGDGQQLIDTRLIAAVRCAPPDNKPTPFERDTCAPWLDAELAMVLPTVRAVVCLGMFGWDATLRALVRQGFGVPRPRPRFGHGTRLTLSADCGKAADDTPTGSAGFPQLRVDVLGCFHPSQQNTFTGRLTESMLDAVLGEAAALTR